MSGRLAALATSAALALAATATATTPAAATTSATASPPPTPPPHLAVTAADLIERSSGRQLFGANSDAPTAIASTTKIMTALVTLQHVQDLGQVFTQNDYRSASIDSQIGLAPGERMSVHDLLLALLLPSADDAAEDLAYNVGDGSVTRFVAMMNAEAERLGLAHTHYSTPIGLDTPGNYSTAADLVKLTAYVLEHEPFFARAVDTRAAELTTGSHSRYIVNRNDLVGRVPWITGVKTGHTLDAGYVLVASGTRDGMSLIGVVLGTASEYARDQNALALLDYGFGAYRIAHPLRDGQVLARPAVADNPGHHAIVIASEAFSKVVRRSDRIRTRVKLYRQLAGPLPRHAIVGQATVLIDGRAVIRVPLLLARALPAVSPLTQAARFLSKGSTLLSLAVLLVAGFLLVRMRRLLRPKEPTHPAAGDRLEAG